MSFTKEGIRRASGTYGDLKVELLDIPEEGYYVIIKDAAKKTKNGSNNSFCN